MWFGYGAAPPSAPELRAGFERIDATLPADLPAHNNSGGIGWGASWRMLAYLLMAEATGDPEYVRRMARMADVVVDARDHLRGVYDHRGLSEPVWSSTGRFTVGTVTVPDTTGADALQVRVCPPDPHLAEVEIVDGADGTFDMTVTRGRLRFATKGVSLDPTDGRPVDRVAYEAYDADTGVTVRLRGTASPGRRIRAGLYKCRTERVGLSAQTGMITYPMAGLARMAQERPALVPADVAAKVDGYLDVITTALASHDYQWREAGGRGWYVWLADEPMSFAGAELPTNEFLAVGSTYVQLAAVTGDPAYAHRAAAMARTFRAEMTARDGTLTWPYWPSFGRVYRGWTASGDPAGDGSDYRPSFPGRPWPEDVTHALVDIGFLVLYHDTPSLPKVFTDADMRAIAHTFRHNVLVARRRRRPTVRRDIGGDGRPGTPRHEGHVAAWLPLSRWDRRMAAPVHEVYRRRRAASPPLSFDAYCAALLARWTR